MDSRFTLVLLALWASYLLTDLLLGRLSKPEYRIPRGIAVALPSLLQLLWLGLIVHLCQDSLLVVISALAVTLSLHLYSALLQMRYGQQRVWLHAGTYLLHLLWRLILTVGLLAPWPLLAQWWSSPALTKGLLVLVAYLLVLQPVNVLIGYIMERWHHVHSAQPPDNAGARIGMLERFLVLTFIFSEHFAAIGFLLAAKSILRVGDLKEPQHREITQYILVGSFLSFAITIPLGLLVNYWLHN